jgi:transposase
MFWLLAMRVVAHAQWHFSSRFLNRGFVASNKSDASKARLPPKQRVVVARFGSRTPSGSKPKSTSGPTFIFESSRRLPKKSWDGKSRMSHWAERVAHCGELEKKTIFAVEQQREDVVEARRQWSATQLSIDPDQIVFIDETWAKTNMTRTYGRSPQGTRLIAHVPYGRWETTTFLGAMRSTGFGAPLCIDGAINGLVFKAWVEQHLVPTLRSGDIVVMDNLSSHKVAGVVAAIEAVGAEVRYLPPYSPDLNPIELAFSKFKKLLRDGAERTNDKLCGEGLDLFTEHECRNYLKHCGYRYS